MDLSEEDIRGFIEAWRKDFGETLSREEAESTAKRLLDFFVRLEEEARR